MTGELSFRGQVLFGNMFKYSFSGVFQESFITGGTTQHLSIKFSY